MPIIKPVSDLRNKSNEILAIVSDAMEPVFITKGGEGKAVIMSMNFFDQLKWKMELYQKLATSMANKAAGDKGKPYKEVFRDLRKKYFS